GTVPASLIVGARYSDEGCRPLWGGRARVCARLRCVSRRTRTPRRQRTAVLDRCATGGRALRSVRNVSVGSVAARTAPPPPARVGRLGPHGTRAGHGKPSPFSYLTSESVNLVIGQLGNLVIG